MSVLVGRACSSAQISWSIVMLSGGWGENISSGCGPHKQLGKVEGLGGGVQIFRFGAFCVALHEEPRGAATLAPGEIPCSCLK